MPPIVAAKLPRRQSDDRFERAAEVALVVVTHLEADLRATAVRRQQQVLGSLDPYARDIIAVSYTHLRAHETPEHLVCRLLLEKKKKK